MQFNRILIHINPSFWSSGRMSNTTDQIKPAIAVVARPILNMMTAKADSFHSLNGLPSDLKNSVQHAWVSAELTRSLGTTPAKVLGDLKEIPNISDSGNNSVLDDEFKDQFNNEVGRRIAEFVVERNLHPSTINDLMKDAIDRGDILSGSSASSARQSGMQPRWQGPSPETWNAIKNQQLPAEAIMPHPYASPNNS